MAKGDDYEVVRLDPKQIKVGWRARQDYGDLKELADSIKQVGQLHPVVVREMKKGHAIIAGLRRVRACRLLGIKVRATVIAPEDEEENLLIQLHENVKRKNFDQLEVGEGLQRFRSVYEKTHPEVKHGGAGRKRPKGKDAPERFAKVASHALSVGERTVYDLLEIAELPEKEKDKIETDAKTTAQRNRAAKAAVSKVRKKRRADKLEEEVKEKQKKRAKEGKKTKASKETIFLFPGKFEDAIAKGSIPAGAVDLVCTDPPYSIKRSVVNYGGTINLNKDEADAWDHLDIDWIIRTAPLLASKGSLIAFCPLEAIGTYMMACIKAGLHYRGAIIWHKTNPVLAHRQVYVPSVEAIVWATKGKTSYYFPDWDNAGTREAHNMIEGPICQGDERLDHPTQKPLWLMKRLLKRHSAKGDVIYDPFAGVGTTLVACKKMGRTCYGSESKRSYVKLAVTRLKAL